MAKVFFITGTYHGSIVIADSEGEARFLFHNKYNGETIIHVIIEQNGKRKTLQTANEQDCF